MKSTCQAFELKKLQTPLYEEFYNSLAACSPSFAESTRDETTPKYLKLPPKSRSPSRGPTGAPSPTVDSLNTGSPGSNSRHVSNIGNASDQSSQDNPSPSPSDWKGRVVDAQQEPSSPRLVSLNALISLPQYDFLLVGDQSEILYCATHSMSFSERQRKWKEELDQELERKRGIYFLPCLL